MGRGTLRPQCLRYRVLQAQHSRLYRQQPQQLLRPSTAKCPLGNSRRVALNVKAAQQPDPYLATSLAEPLQAGIHLAARTFRDAGGRRSGGLRPYCTSRRPWWLGDRQVRRP